MFYFWNVSSRSWNCKPEHSWQPWQCSQILNWNSLHCPSPSLCQKQKIRKVYCTVIILLNITKSDTWLYKYGVNLYFNWAWDKIKPFSGQNQAGWHSHHTTYWVGCSSHLTHIMNNLTHFLTPYTSSQDGSHATHYLEIW